MEKFKIEANEEFFTNVRTTLSTLESGIQKGFNWNPGHGPIS